MPTDSDTSKDIIDVADIKLAMRLVVFNDPKRTEGPAPACAWPKLCGESCRFPRYHRDGKPDGLVAEILTQLGFPIGMLKNMDMRYELGEVLHPGVKITRCREPALRRINPDGLKLLGFVQELQHSGMTWAHIDVETFRPRRMISFLDARRRPWLY